MMKLSKTSFLCLCAIAISVGLFLPQLACANEVERSRPIERLGHNDDGIKPIPKIQRSGTDDDSLRPMPKIQRSGTDDDSLRPMPKIQRSSMPKHINVR